MHMAQRQSSVAGEGISALLLMVSGVFASAVRADVEGGRTDLFQDILFRSQCDGMTDANIHKGDRVARAEGPITFEDGRPTGQTAIPADGFAAILVGPRTWNYCLFDMKASRVLDPGQRASETRRLVMDHYTSGRQQQIHLPIQRDRDDEKRLVWP